MYYQASNPYLKLEDDSKILKMNTNNFFLELIARLGKSNPKFFDYVQLIALGVAALSAGFKVLPDTLLPPWLAWLKSTTVLIASGVAAVVAQLPNRDVNDAMKKK